MKIIKSLLYIHQLPQNIMGLLLTIKPIHIINDFRLNDGTSTKIYFIKNVFNCSVSLGEYIILDDLYYEDCIKRTLNCINMINHEHGHQIQSKHLGWLYLIVVGLISLIFNNLWDRLFHDKWLYKDRYKWYYNRFPEKGADIYGKVNRQFK